VIAVSQVIGGLVSLSVAVIGDRYIKSKSEGMQTFFDRAGAVVNLMLFTDCTLSF
jgi:hypothetical protein